MKVVFNRWSRSWQSVSYDLVSGHGRVLWFFRKKDRCSGFAEKINGRWYSLWSSGEFPVFQVGSKTIPLTDDYRFVNIECGRERIFSVEKDGEVLISVSYKAYGRFFLEFVLYEDLEDVDFLYWVFCVWGDSRARRDLCRAWKTLNRQ